MSYIENYLIQDEIIIKKVKPHWFIFAAPAMIFIFGILFLGSSTGLWFVIFISILLGIKQFIYYLTSEFGVTNKRIIAKFGFIKRTSIEIMLSKVEGLSIDQTILGRVVGYGSVQVNGIGGSKEPIPYIPTPMKFRRIVQETINQLD